MVGIDLVRWRDGGARHRVQPCYVQIFANSGKYSRDCSTCEMIRNPFQLCVGIKISRPRLCVRQFSSL
jgi:hypothetical protein